MWIRHKSMSIRTEVHSDWWVNVLLSELDRVFGISHFILASFEFRMVKFNDGSRFLGSKNVWSRNRNTRRQNDYHSLYIFLVLEVAASQLVYFCSPAGWYGILGTRHLLFTNILKFMLLVQSTVFNSRINQSWSWTYLCEERLRFPRQNSHHLTTKCINGIRRFPSNCPRFTTQAHHVVHLHVTNFNTLENHAQPIEIVHDLRKFLPTASQSCPSTSLSRDDTGTLQENPANFEGQPGLVRRC